MKTGAISRNQSQSTHLLGLGRSLLREDSRNQSQSVAISRNQRTFLGLAGVFFVNSGAAPYFFFRIWTSLYAGYFS